MINANRLTEAQRDGRACIDCGRDDRPMVPVGRIDGCQIFRCSSCTGNGHEPEGR